MRKIALFFISTLLLSSCSLDDDKSRFAFKYSVVTGTDLPESFERGKTYTIKVTYLLPTPCHTAAGIQVQRGNTTGNQRRDIYVVGISKYDVTLTECTIEEKDLERESSFTLFIDEKAPYTFYLWDGYDEDENNQFTVVEVPVIE